MLTKSRFPVKRTRVAPRSFAPFAAGLEYHPLPAEPAVDDRMPRRVRWEPLNLEPLPELTISGAWGLPGEDVHSWSYGHSED